jgi:hypothetical protein
MGFLLVKIEFGLAMMMVQLSLWVAHLQPAIK